jgi:transposase
MKIETKSLDHLGIVSGVCQEIGLVSLIDSLVKSDPQRPISVGEGIYSMILNGLGFVNSTLYLSPEYFRDKALSVLFRRHVEASAFNSHSLSSSLDAVYEYGIDKLFFNISLQSIKRYDIKLTSRHLDGTTLSVHGDGYKQSEKGTIELKRGHNKQGQHDLRQFMMELICGNKEGIPLFMHTGDGNATDKTLFPEVLELYKKELTLAGESYNTGHYVADSALYAAQTLQKIRDILWISRVPETINRANKQIDDSESRKWHLFSEHTGYKYQEVTNDYGGIAQRWLIIHSENSYKSSQKSVERKVEKQLDKLEKLVKKERIIEYSSDSLAQQAVHDWFSSLKNTEKEYFKIGKISVKKVEYYAKGRRKKDAVPLKVSFFISTVGFEREETIIEKVKQRGAKFILATNDLDSKQLTPNKWLHTYKNEQQNTERGFKFIKDPVFMLDKIFLKLPRRIMALTMVIALCLLVYTLAQYKLRKNLVDKKLTITNQLKKEIQNPTMKWIFTVMRGIQVAYVEIDGIIHRSIINLNEQQRNILNCFGDNIKAFYTL